VKRAFCAIALFLALATTARADIFKAEIFSEDAEVISDIVVNGAPVIVMEALGSFDLWYVEDTDRGPEVFYAGVATSYDVMVAPRGVGRTTPPFTPGMICPRERHPGTSLIRGLLAAVAQAISMQTGGCLSCTGGTRT
jgi:hypothetical protein